VAKLEQARVSLQRTEIRSPVNGLGNQSIGTARRLRQCRSNHRNFRTCAR
jgi:hypothetical protein